jgi:hypothetical protein
LLNLVLRLLVALAPTAARFFFLLQRRFSQELGFLVGDQLLFGLFRRLLLAHLRFQQSAVLCLLLLASLIRVHVSADA